jgi:hypothetical protein
MEGAPATRWIGLDVVVKRKIPTPITDYNIINAKETTQQHKNNRNYPFTYIAMPVGYTHKFYGTENVLQYVCKTICQLSHVRYWY